MKSELSKSPLVSVCIACFSPGEVFVATLRSVLDQTYTNLEILIWDNAPNGEIETIIQSFSDPRVRYFVSSENKGPYGGLNELLDRAK